MLDLQDDVVKMFGLNNLVMKNKQRDIYFNLPKNKTKLIQICGHYVFSNEIFQTEIKSKLKGIDTKIKKNIKSKLDELFSK